jgi:hypothetical protein
MRHRKGIHRVCPKCGKVGILTKKWGAQIYYPQASSAYVNMPHAFETGYVTGERYRGPRHRGMSNSENFDKKSSYKVRYGKYEQWCIAHYESGVRSQCSLRKGRDYDFHWRYRLPSLRKPESRQYQRKKDLRYNNRLSQKISEIKKEYRLYL